MSGCHQILTGACNSGDRSFSLGNIDNISFLAYASGCNLVILSFDFQRVQIIPGDVQISCVHCSSECGKIAAAYQIKIRIFEPTFSKQPDNLNPLFRYRWRETSNLSCECRVNSLSWDGEGGRLLMGGTSLQMWKLTKKFTIGESDGDPHAKLHWESIWKCATATEVNFLSFSPDSSLFATAGKFDRLVKIWYPVTRPVLNHNGVMFDFIYLSHPRAVTGFSWRQTSKYMPKGAVFNALITSCLDKICRIWTETILPDDSFSTGVNRDREMGGPDLKFNRTHKHRIMKRLQHVKSVFHVKRSHRPTSSNSHSITAAFPLPLTTSLPILGLSAYSTTLDFTHAHLSHSHSPFPHFHLAGSIHGETDISLVPPLKGHPFRVFWINNKEMFFSQQAEALLHDLCLRDSLEDPPSEAHKNNNKNSIKNSAKNNSERDGVEDSSGPSLSSSTNSSSLSLSEQYPASVEAFESKLESLLKEWHRTPDILVSLHPIDGSFLVWSIDWLDEHMPGCFKQCQISFSSCIPSAIPLADATSMSTPNLYLFPLEKIGCSRASMMTKHHNGTLNLWTLSFGDESKFTNILSVAHAKRASGHRFQVREMACHPVLPLVLTGASHHASESTLGDTNDTIESKNDSKNVNYSSELILWRVDPIGPLCKSGGVVEIARINSSLLHAFPHFSWVPGILPSTSLFTSSGCFVSSDGSSLRVYQAVLDATNLLAEISTAFRKRKASLNDSVVSLSSSSSLSSLPGELDEEGGEIGGDFFAIVSQQSTSRPGCILQLDKISNEIYGEVEFISVFRDELNGLGRSLRRNVDYRESFHLCLVERGSRVHVWRLEIFSPSSSSTQQPNGSPLSHNNDINTDRTTKKSFLGMKIEKILVQLLNDIPSEHLSYSACSGHFVCGSSYSLLTTSRSEVKVWRLHEDPVDKNIKFIEWNSLKSSGSGGSGGGRGDGVLLQASAAYSGRIACVYKLEAKKEIGNFEDGYTCAVTVYECESTGGMEWLLEDRIELKTEDDVDDVHLEWVPKHDAQHILALAVSDMVCLFAHVSSELGGSVGWGAGRGVPTLSPSSKSQYWLPLHAFKLSSADGLHPFPVRFGWIQASCVVAMRNEMQVYSQWTLENLSDAMIPETLLAKSGLRSEGGGPHIELSYLSGSVGLFEYTRHCFPLLPQFHPKQLMELLNCGKVRWVKLILAHLVKVMSGGGGSGCVGSGATSGGGLLRQSSVNRGGAGGGGEDERISSGGVGSRSWSRGRTLSVSYGAPTPPSPLEHRTSIGGGGGEEVWLNYAEIRAIPPVPLWVLLQADSDTAVGVIQAQEKSKDYNELFNDGGVADDEEEDEIDGSVFDDLLDEEETLDGETKSSSGGRGRRRSNSGQDSHCLAFTLRQSRLLTRILTHASLPGLSAVDQMHLLAVADTVASIGTRLDAASSVVQGKGTHDGTPDSLDECGLRFLLVVKHYNYLLRCLPPAQRVSLQKQGIATSDIVWAFHSESQEDILNLIPPYSKGELTWAHMRELGAGWWLRSNQSLRISMEKMGKYAFQKGNDPMDAALFYLAMRKKSLLWALYRAQRDEKMSSFFSNDFSEERWRKAALKNAYALLGKQRFEHAAAFFLLAGSLKDALEVCVSKLKDIQLGLVVARLYDGGDLDPVPNSVKTLLQNEILTPRDESDKIDPFLRSLSLWLLRDYSGSLSSLLSTTNPSSSVFNFYVYLRSHPLLLRLNKGKKGSGELSYGERNLYYQTAHEHYAGGCPILAIHVLEQLPKGSKKSDKKEGGDEEESKVLSPCHDKKIESGIFEDDEMGWGNSSNKLPNHSDSGAGPKRESVHDFDWSNPALGSKLVEEDELKLDWDTDDALDEEDAISDSEPTKTLTKQQSIVQNDSKLLLKSRENPPNNEEGDENKTEGENSNECMISLELKLASCLKLLSEELVSMVGEIEGTELRLHLYGWLEKQVMTLRELCGYKSDEEEICPEEWNLRDSTTPKFDIGPSIPLHDLLLSEKLDLEWKMGVLSRRRRWLRSNRHLLATLLAFARLHALALAPVHIELVFLLDELQRERAGWSLSSPLPLLHSEFPLLAAVGSPNKGAVSLVQDGARDILQTVSELIAAPVLGLGTQNTANTEGVSTNKTDEKSGPNTPEDEIDTDTNDENNENKPQDKGDEDNETSENNKNDENEDEDEDESSSSSIKKTSKKMRVELSSVVCDWRLVLVLRDSALALSSALFQSLSDSETVEGGSKGEVQLLYSQRRRRRSSTIGDGSNSGSQIISSPDKWPGVATLRGLLSREEEPDSPRLKFLLIESYAAVFIALFIHSLAISDARGVYRILGKKMDAAAFASIFGGGCKRQIKISTMQQLHPQSQGSSSEKDAGDTSPSSVWTTFASLNKARMKFNMKLLGQQFNLTSPRTTPTPSNNKEERGSYREKFLPPTSSIYSYVLSRPRQRNDEVDGKLIFIESDDEEEVDEGGGDEEDDDDIWDSKSGHKTKEEENKEEDPWSYSWRLIRLSSIKLAKAELKRIVNIAGVEMSELSHVSPYLDGVIRVLNVWQMRVFKELESLAPPPLNYLQNSVVEGTTSGPPIHKYKSLLDPTNTPFIHKKSTFGLRRLWNFLVREESVQELFIRFIFAKKRPDETTFSFWENRSINETNTKNNAEESAVDGDEESSTPPVRIVHKEHESISAFCINQSNPSLISISTLKEIQELDIGTLLDMEAWKFEDQSEFDLQNLYKDPETFSSSSYLVVQSPSDRSMTSQFEKPGKGTHSLIKGVNFPGCTNPAFVQYIMDRSKRFLVPIMKHRVDGVRRMASHSSLPLYLSGSVDGSVRLWEFSHVQPVSVPRPPGTFAKVSRIRFHGSKFGVSDGDGRVSLWQIGHNTRPFYTVQCHSKNTSDFVFLGSSSLFASGGMSSDSKNVAIWDTLMPIKKAQVASFACHEQGCVALAYAEEHQCLISAGKKGAISIWDVRQRALRHRFQGHESSVKCLSLDPFEEMFSTGSSEGEIRTWDLTGKLLSSLPHEHVRSGFFKNIPGQGVLQLHLDSAHRLFSTGSDGSLKIRLLPHKNQ